MSKCEDVFFDWWQEYRENSDISKKEAWTIFETAYRAGGKTPWYAITAGQWKALNASFKTEDTK